MGERLLNNAYAFVLYYFAKNVAIELFVALVGMKVGVVGVPPPYALKIIPHNDRVRYRSTLRPFIERWVVAPLH